jgi:hypothetical protein
MPRRCSVLCVLCTALSSWLLYAAVCSLCSMLLAAVYSVHALFYCVT